jgi:hypothetical protein
MQTMLAAAVGLLMTLPHALAAQHAWGVAVEVGIERFWGASGPLAGSDELALRPYRPTHVGIRLDRDIGVVRVAVGGRYAESAVAGEYEGGATVFSEGFTLIELAPEAAVAVLRFGIGGALRLFAGPLLRFWMPPEESARIRMGARGGLELDASLGDRVSAITRVHAGVAGSALDEADVPPGYEVRSMPSAGVSLGVRIDL